VEDVHHRRSPVKLEPEPEAKVKWEGSDIEEEIDVREEKKPKVEKPTKEDENDERRRSPAKSAASPASNNNNSHGVASPASHHSTDENGRDDDVIDDDDDIAEKSVDEKDGGAPEKTKKSHPLAALQMLCEKTEKNSNAGNKNSGPGSSMHGSMAGGNLYGGPSVDPGAILAFSWACNQAVVNDSLLKCPFCDTPFISKGAYRHHLSKMHFVKDGGANGADLLSGKNFLKTPEKSPAGGNSQNQPEGSSSSAGGANAKEENAQSKFQKYSQLAKQLSCSGQP
jgi:hypothetical protein